MSLSGHLRTFSRAVSPANHEVWARWRRAAAVAAMSAVLGVAALAQETPAPTLPAPPAPALIPVPEVATRAESAAGTLDAMAFSPESNEDLRAIDAGLPRAEHSLADLRARSAGGKMQPVPLRDLEDLTDRAADLRSQLKDFARKLTDLATELEHRLAELKAMHSLWVATRSNAAASAAPAALLKRIDAILDGIDKRREQLSTARESLLLRLDEVVQQQAAADAINAQLAQARQRIVESLFVRDSFPIWRLQRPSGTWQEVPQRLRETFAADARTAADYVSHVAPRLPLFAALYLLLVYILRGAARRSLGDGERDASQDRVAAVVELPYSSALLLTLLIAVWADPTSPRVVREILAVAALPPIVRILYQIMDPDLRHAIDVLAALFLVDRVRALCYSVPLLEQAIFVVEMAVTLLLLILFVRFDIAQVAAAREGPDPVSRWTSRGFRSAIVLSAFALLAGALGFMQLARVIANTVLGAAYLGTSLYAAYRVADGLVVYGVRSRPARLLLMLQRRRALVQTFVLRFLRWAAFALWATVVLRFAGIFDRLIGTAAGVLGAKLSYGAFSLSLGDVVVFALTLWLASQVSRFLRFVLEEDVYPRLPLSKGLPYAVSTVAHYTILSIGFFIGLAALGLDFTRFSLLAGAFGVGIGFGLQNVVNNFVSGLILLFERPVQVGDTVAIGDLMGDVKRIGIRSSTIRTWEGAEVIVPNASLISDPVTNWTHSDRMRRIDISVGVAYGTDPERVLELLRSVARGHKAVASSPEAVALFMGFGDSSLDFQLRVWTDRFESWVQIRSELTVGIHTALRDAGITIPFPQRDVHLFLPENVETEEGDSES